jgi:hypothetical protein
MNRSIVLILSCLCLVGCASEPTARRRAEPRVKPELVLLVPDEPATLAAPSGSTSAHLPDQRAVLIAPDVIAYPLAARQDPNHPDIMYGGSWAFRKTSAQWRLGPAPTQDVALGPVSRDDRIQIQPLQTQEIASSVIEQRAFNDQNRQAITRLIRLQDDLQKQVADLRARTQPSPSSSAKNDDEAMIPPRPNTAPELPPKEYPRPEKSAASVSHP